MQFLIDFAPLALIYFILANILAFALCGIDKRRAEKKKYRISEQTLLTLAILGGAIGFFTAMRIFRHKTRKKSFYITVPIFAIIQLAICFLYILMVIPLSIF